MIQFNRDDDDGDDNDESTPGETNSLSLSLSPPLSLLIVRRVTFLHF